MKRPIYLAAIVLAVAVTAGCKCNKKLPSATDAATAVNAALNDGDYDQFVEFIAFDVQAPVDTVKSEKSNFTQVLKTHHAPKVAEKGGVKSTMIKSATVTPAVKPVDKTAPAVAPTAQVEVTNTYNNDDTEDVAYDMVLVDNVWKVKVGPDKEVWKTKMPDGQRVGFKLRDEAHRDFYKERYGDDRDFIKDKDYDNKDVVKVKEDGEKEVTKIKDKKDAQVIKIKEDGEKEVIRVEK